MALEWLIDLIQEWVQDQGYLTDGFVNRGDPGVPDKTIVGLTLNGVWQEWDLSAIVPEGAKGVVIKSEVLANAVGKYLKFQYHGNTGEKNVSSIWSQVALVVHSADHIVACDADRKIDYEGTPAGWVAIALVVKGWWF